MYNLKMAITFTLLPKVQLHVSALENNHLQVVHESLEGLMYNLKMAITFTLLPKVQLHVSALTIAIFRLYMNP